MSSVPEKVDAVARLLESSASQLVQLEQRARLAAVAAEVLRSAAPDAVSHLVTTVGHEVAENRLAARWSIALVRAREAGLAEGDEATAAALLDVLLDFSKLTGAFLAARAAEHEKEQHRALGQAEALRGVLRDLSAPSDVHAPADRDDNT